MALKPLKHVGVPHSFSPFCSILHSRATPWHILGLPNSKKITGHTSHIQYPTWKSGLQQITQLFFICKFSNVEKYRDIKYSLSLIFQDFLGTSCNKNSQFISLKSYSNTDWAFNICFWKTLFLISRTIKFIITLNSWNWALSQLLHNLKLSESETVVTLTANC